MNDSELITAVRGSVTGVRTATPVEQVVARGRAVRARRRIPAIAGAMAVVVAAVLGVTALLPGHPVASRRSSVQLAAWTVVRHPGGSIRVTIRSLRNPAGLQGKLRADGVPASVTFSGQVNLACRIYPAGSSAYNAFPKVVQAADRTKLPRKGTVVVIHASALPRHAGLLLVAGFAQGPHHGTARLISVGGALVHRSLQCTGS